MRWLARCLAAVALATGCAHPVDDGTPSDDTTFGAQGGTCDNEGKAIVVASADGAFHRFSPGTGAFEVISRAHCESRGAKGAVWNAAIDRGGTAWVRFVGELPENLLPKLLYPVTIADGTCGEPIVLDDSISGGPLAAGIEPGIILGLRWATPEGNSAAAADHFDFITFDTTTARVVTSTPIAVAPHRMPTDAAITQTSDGRVLGFLNALHEQLGVRPYFATVEVTAGGLGPSPGSFPHIETRTLSTNASDPPSALVEWGADRWLFTGDPATESPGRIASASMLTRLPLDGAEPEIVKREMPLLVVAAGAVRCASGPSVR